MRPEDLKLLVDGIPVLSAPQLFVVSKKWTRKFYAFEDDATCLTNRGVEETSAGALRIGFPLKSPSGEFSGELLYEIGPGKKFRITVRGELTTPTEARIEHRFGRWAPGWFVGHEWSAKLLDGTTTSGVVPHNPLGPALSAATIVEGIRELEVTAPLHSLRLRTSGNYRFALVDYRLNPYNDGERTYWLGILESPVRAGKPFEYWAEFEFSTREAERPTSVTRVSGAPKNTDRILDSAIVPRLVLPTPKRITWQNGRTPLTQPLSIVVRGTSHPDTLIGARNLTEEILGRAVAKYGSSLKWDKNGEARTNTLTITFTDLAKRQEAEGKFDYYKLAASERGLAIETASTGGLRAGLATLIQLLGAEGDKIGFAHCEVEDYATLPVRAVHFFSGKNGGKLQKDMLRNILLPLKFNMLIYQCEYIKWQAVPEIHHPEYGMEKAEAQAVIDEARRLGFEVVPLINTFGHCEWLLDNNAYRHLADNPLRPYAYDPSNPKVYELGEKIYDEALAMFQPRYFHIGHDEVTLHGFPQKPENKRRGAEALFLEDILHYYNWLKRRGVRTMMWGDQLLAPGEGAGATMAASKEQAASLRAHLPKDIIIADWHYDPNPPEDFINLRVLTRDGFDVLACTWYSPLNILRFAKAAAWERQEKSEEKVLSPHRGQVLGLVQTTWAGYSFNQESFDRNINQYSAYVLAGEAAWRGGARELNEVPYDYQQEFARLWTQDLLPLNGGDGWFVNLSRVANVQLERPTGTDGERGAASAFDLKGLKSGLQRLGRWLVYVPELHGAPGACLFDGQFNAIRSGLDELRIPTDRPARALFFVVASTASAPSDFPIAQTTIEYEDATSDVIEWRPGINVLGLDDERTMPRVPVVWSSGKGVHPPRYLHGYLWVNPSPLKKIREMRTNTLRRGGGLILVAVSGLE
jgi:hypothetical protein